MGLEVPKSGDDVEAVVDGVVAAAALPEYLPVIEPGDDVFDADSDAALSSVMVVVDGVAGADTRWCGDGVDAALAAIAQAQPGAVEQVGHGVAGERNVVALPGRQCPTVMTRRWSAQMMI